MSAGSRIGRPVNIELLGTGKEGRKDLVVRTLSGA